MSLGVGQVSLLDLNDAIISGVAPVNPSVGQLWIDESTNPKLLKKWDGSTWTPLGEVSNIGTGQTITEIMTTLGNMANDNLLDFDERKTVRDKLLDIIGNTSLLTDITTTLPTATTLDSSVKGDFYNARRSAVVAGIPTNNAIYVAVATQYNNLKTYLESLTPIKPWNLSQSSKNTNITVAKDTFRTHWLNYYNAVNDLAIETSKKLKENVDNIEVGGTNLIPNSSAEKGLMGWTTVGSSNGLILDTGRVYGNSVRVNVTAIQGGIGTPNTIINSIIPSQEYTISFWAKASVACNIGHTLRFYDSSNVESNPITTQQVAVLANTWTHIKQTFTIPVGSVKMSTSPRIINVASGTLWIDEVMLERGNKSSSWSPAPEDFYEDISVIKSEISATNGKISLVVSENNTILGTNLVSAINLLPDSIKITSKNIEFTGTVTYESLNDLLKAEIDTLGSWKFTGKTTIDGGKIETDTITASQIQANSINANHIQAGSLVVGTNVTMGTNAYISWNNVRNQPTIPTTASQVGALSSSSPMLTYINSNGIYTGTITANQINAGSISADRISGGTISGVNIDVDTNVYVGQNIYMMNDYASRFDEKGIHFDSSSESFVSNIKGTYLKIDIESTTINLKGAVNFSNAVVIGLNTTAKFG